MNPGEAPFPRTAPLMVAQAAAGLCLGFAAAGAMRRNHLDTVFAQLLIEFVTVVGAVPIRLSRPASIM